MMSKIDDGKTPAAGAEKPLSFFEVFKQALSLMFALQNRSGQKRLLDLAETNPMPLIMAGVTAMAIFFLFCFISSQLMIGLLSK